MTTKKEAPKKTKEDKPNVVKSLQDLKALYSSTDVHEAIDKAIELVKTNK